MSSTGEKSRNGFGPEYISLYRTPRRVICGDILANQATDDFAQGAHMVFSILRTLMIALVGMPTIALALDGPMGLAPLPRVQEKHFIDNAIQVAITPRGMSFFSTGLGDVLANQGLSLEQGYFQGFTWQAERSYKIEELSLPDEQRNLLNMAKNLLTKWLVGFTFNEFRPTIQVGDLGYIAKFNKFSLVSDHALLIKLRKTTGAILAIELEISEITSAIDQVRATDQNNQFLGKVGADGVSIKVGSPQNPLKVRLPFYVLINDQQELEFHAFDLDSNLDTVDLAVKYKKLISPQIALEINGHRYEMNQKQLETEVQNQMPEILKQARGFMKKFATEQLPTMLNEQSKKLLAGGMEELSRMDPVGAVKNPCLPPPTPFLLGMTPQKDGLSDDGSIQFKLNAYVEDPQNPRLPVDPSKSAQGTLRLSSVPVENYDIALAIDRGFINRMLQLSYSRGIFNDMPIDKNNPNGPRMDLTEQPVLDYYPTPSGVVESPGATFLKMTTKARIHAGFLKGFQQKLAVREPFEVELAVIVKMMINQYGQVNLYYYGVDPSSVRIDRKYLTTIGSLFDGVVRDQAIAALEQVALAWRNSGAKVSDDPLPIPQEIGGIRLTPQMIKFMPSGHLTLFMNYTKPGSPLPPAIPPRICTK